MCQEVGTEPALPRRCGRQHHRENTPADTPVQYYRRTISTPFVDHLLTEIDARFTRMHLTALQGLCLVPAVLLIMPSDVAKEKVMEFAQMYKEDLDSPGSVQSELHSWRTKWMQKLSTSGQQSLPSTATTALQQASCMFPNIQILLKILCTMPVTTCTSERSHSGLKRIKTTLRSTMDNERLTGLALLHLHHKIPVDTTAVLDEFVRRHERKMEMFNILLDNE